VKIFPADGPGYIKAIRGPLPHLRIIPTSGVGLENAAEFLAGRVCCAGCRLEPGFGQNHAGEELGELTVRRRHTFDIVRKFARGKRQLKFHENEQQNGLLAKCEPATDRSSEQVTEAVGAPARRRPIA